MSNDDDEAIAREAYRRWCASDCPGLDDCIDAIAFKAGAKWATDRSNQRTVSLVEALTLYGDWDNCDADLESVLSAVGEGKI